MSTRAARFAEHYRAIVQPRISRAIDVAALFIALGEDSLNDHAQRITRRAWRLGGSHLPPRLWEDLEAWIDDQLLQRTAEADDRIQAQAHITAKVRAQVWAWERSIR